MAKILYGAPVAENIDNRTKQTADGKKLAILLPDDPSSASYKNAIRTKAERLGVAIISDTDEADGVIGGSPEPAKDIDCQTPENLGKLFAGSPVYKPATAQAVIEILRFYDIDPTGKSAVIIGRSTVVGKPLAHLLLEQDATVTVCHSNTPDIGKFTKAADIIISAAGKANLLTAEMVSSKSVVIDVGTNFVDGKLVGDVDFEGVKDIVQAISPVPGGVGPVTTSVLLGQISKLKNTA